MSRLKGWISPLNNCETWIKILLLALRQAKRQHKFLPKCWVLSAIVSTLNTVSKWYGSCDSVLIQVFVMNLSGVHACFYWAKFSPEYLRKVRFHNLSELKDIPEVLLRHSRPRLLVDPEQRDIFLEEFASVIRCVAGGYGKVGFVRRDVKTPIHRDLNNAGDKNTNSDNGLSDCGESDDGKSANCELDDSESDDGELGDGDSDDDPFKD